MNAFSGGTNATRLCGIKNYFSEKKAIFFKIRFNPLKVSQIFTVHVTMPVLFG